ncbi:TerB family tellurite resistance protein [Mucilaginibacter sp. UC70_90]
MKKYLTMLLFLLGTISYSRPARAQSAEVVQLLLNVEKLGQFKQILSDMKAGYDILDKGYGTIKNISQGNFNMHQLFLDGLWAVSPTVRQYGRITDIVNDQVLLVKEYKKAYDRFRSGGMFQPKEVSYIGSVYSNLINASLQNLDELTNVITANKLRMADDERIKAIDRIYADMEDKLQFLRSFNNSTSVLAFQRQKAIGENQVIQKNYGIN